VTEGSLDVNSDIFDAPGRSAIVAVYPDTLMVTATAETRRCRVGDVGTYRWALDGEGTILRLKAIPADPCAAREDALNGDWVRADLPSNLGPLAELSAGRHETSLFDPFDDPNRPGQLSFTVPEGWRREMDQGDSLLLHDANPPIQGQPPDDTFITVLARPRMAAELEEGADCIGMTVAPDVGTTVDEMVAAITTRPGIVSTTPANVSIGGYDGVQLDLAMDPAWSGGCQAIDEVIVGVPVLATRAGPGAAVGPDLPIRIVLLDLGAGRTAAIVIAGAGPSQGRLEEAINEATPIIESFEFHSAAP
jgi:hypothetical protein